MQHSQNILQLKQVAQSNWRSYDKYLLGEMCPKSILQIYIWMTVISFETSVLDTRSFCG